ncbi:hypothetical protein, partial [Salmonella enterica]|uniref:hypothetical protein n=1 Tax=Salmonella enterica TaxID=28901 RepID=UPI001F3F4FA3
SAVVCKINNLFIINASVLNYIKLLRQKKRILLNPHKIKQKHKKHNPTRIKKTDTKKTTIKK